MPHRRLSSMKLSSRSLGHHWSCSPRPLHGGTSSLVAPGRRFGVPRGLLRSARGTVVEIMCSRDRCCEFPPLELLSVRAGHGCPHQDALSSCRLSRSPERSRP
jgi:hypothetical protein